MTDIEFKIFKEAMIGYARKSMIMKGGINPEIIIFCVPPGGDIQQFSVQHLPLSEEMMSSGAMKKILANEVLPEVTKSFKEEIVGTAFISEAWIRTALLPNGVDPRTFRPTGTELDRMPKEEMVFIRLESENHKEFLTFLIQRPVLTPRHDFENPDGIEGIFIGLYDRLTAH